MSKFIEQIRRQFNFFGLSSLLLVAFITLPLLILVTNLYDSNSEIWDHIASTRLNEYLSNTFILVLGIGTLTAIIGVATAWVVSIYEFPFRKAFEVGLILPMAIPSYVAAFTYVGMFDYTSYFQSTLRKILGTQDQLFDIMTLPFLIFIISFVIFPYVFVIVRVSFSKQSSTILEAASLLGKTPFQVFYKVALPMARPAIVGGVILVIMELLNDYGAMKYFGINTFTTAIAEIWFSFGDLNTTIRLAVYLLAITFILILSERFFRSKGKFDNSTSSYTPLERIPTKGFQKVLMFSICFIPFLFGFILPVIQLITWTIKTNFTSFNSEFFELSFNSFKLAFITSIIALFFAIPIVYATRTNKGFFSKFLLKLGGMGYAIPGAVVAIGVMIPYHGIHSQLMEWFPDNYDAMENSIRGAFIAIVFAYIVRFIALGLNAMESGLERISPTLAESAQLLGKGSMATLFKIDLPLLRNALLSGVILVFVNILKELPLTIILRPFNFDTLATKTFEIAKNEMLPESAAYSLVIILVGLIPLLILNKLTDQKS